MGQEATDQQTVNVTVHLIHGDPLRFRLDHGRGGRFSLAGEIEKTLATDSLAVELQGRLVIIPNHNIQRIEIDPCPVALPPSVIKGAESLD
ncbi:MAG: hypothetical protein KDH88_19145 [Chromatiales bacterium]|nr:hypothetical protein [Chromatiales bacterium]